MRGPLRTPKHLNDLHTDQGSTKRTDEYVKSSRNHTHVTCARALVHLHARTNAHRPPDYAQSPY